MNLFGYELTVRKKVPEGARATRSLATDADRLSGKLDPLMAHTGAPAAGQPPNPGPLPVVDPEASKPEDLRHHPLRWNFPYAFNQVWTPRHNTLTPFALLRQFADVADIVRICIETRKDQMSSLGHDIVPRDKRAEIPSETLERQIKQAEDFFRRPDRRRSFATWLRMAIEEILVIDALSIYRRPTRGRAAGLGGQTFSLELKDGATFLPLLDTEGDTPMPPAVAYRQIIYGQPVIGGDCTLEQLYYRPRTVRTFTPYGLSPTEAVILTINAALNRQVFNLSYYTEGNIPEGLLEAPKGFTTKQLIEFQEYLDDYLSGDFAKRRKLKAVHEGGSKVFQFKDPDFQTIYDEWLMKVTCAAFAVPPQEIGFTEDVNRATGQMQENVTYRRGVKPLSGFLKDLFDDVLADDLLMPDLQWVFSGGEPEDKKLQAEVDQIYVGMGKVSVDELRMRDGQDPIGLGPYVETAMGPVFVEDLLAAPPDDDPDDSEATNAGDGKTSEGNSRKSEGNSDVTEAAMADLKRWRAVAIKAAKDGRPSKAFASTSIPIELHARVERFLARAGDDVGKIVTAFDLAVAEHQAVAKQGEFRRLTRLERSASQAYRRLMAAHYKRQGKALEEHLRKGLEP